MEVRFIGSGHDIKEPSPQQSIFEKLRSLVGA
jgi:hypothetical protein